MNRQTNTARLCGDPDPDRHAKSDALRAALPIKPRGIPFRKQPARGR